MLLIAGTVKDSAAVLTGSEADAKAQLPLPAETEATGRGIVDLVLELQCPVVEQVGN